jgi:hypothetical protein
VNKLGPTPKARSFEQPVRREVNFTHVKGPNSGYPWLRKDEMLRCRPELAGRKVVTAEPGRAQGGTYWGTLGADGVTVLAPGPANPGSILGYIEWELDGTAVLMKHGGSTSPANRFAGVMDTVSLRAE